MSVQAENGPDVWAGRRAGAVPLGANPERKIYIARKSSSWGRLLCRTRNSGVVIPLIYTRWNLTPINLLVRHIAVHLMR